MSHHLSRGMYSKGGAPNMCITIVKRSNFEQPYLDNYPYWVTNEQLNGFELGHGAPEPS